MTTSLIQLIVLAAIAVFLILRLRKVLGTREGFEKPRVQPAPVQRRNGPDFEVIEGGPDSDITNHVKEDSDAAKALAAMKLIEPGFSVGGFLEGSKGAYEMILMAFERGDIADVEAFLGDEVHQAFVDVIGEREDQGLTVDANFIGVRDVTLTAAAFDRDTQEAEITVRFVGEISSAVKNSKGEIIEGDPNSIKKQKDSWTFARIMGSDDPNWKLVATGE